MYEDFTAAFLREQQNSAKKLCRLIAAQNAKAETR